MSVASAAASGSAAPEFIRLPECETTEANQLDGYWQRRGNDGNDNMEAKHHHRRTCTGPLLRSTGHLPGPEPVAHTQIMENHPRGQALLVNQSNKHMSTELSITSWNPDTLNHGKLERFPHLF